MKLEAQNLKISMDQAKELEDRQRYLFCLGAEMQSYNSHMIRNQLDCDQNIYRIRNLTNASTL